MPKRLYATRLHAGVEISETGGKEAGGTGLPHLGGTL